MTGSLFCQQHCKFEAWIQEFSLVVRNLEKVAGKSKVAPMRVKNEKKKKKKRNNGK
jgi:hypothetical protein